jgi:hypothetical protein
MGCNYLVPVIIGKAPAEEFDQAVAHIQPHQVISDFTRGYNFAVDCMYYNCKDKLLTDIYS